MLLVVTCEVIQNFKSVGTEEECIIWRMAFIFQTELDGR